METGEIDHALASFNRALAIQPTYEKALYNLGITWIWKGDHTRAIECLSRVAETTHHHGRGVTEPVVYRSRLKHDIEQIRYLLSRRLLGQEQHGYLDALEQLNRLLASQFPDRNRCPIDPVQAESISPPFNQFLHRTSCHRLPDGALSDQL